MYGSLRSGVEVGVTSPYGILFFNTFEYNHLHMIRSK